METVSVGEEIITEQKLTEDTEALLSERTQRVGDD